MITEIRVYWANNPLISSQGNNFTLGYIDDTNQLFSLANNASGVTITLIEPANTQLLNNNQTILIPASYNNVTLRFSITYQGYTQYYSYVIVPALPQITLNDIYNRLISYLPKNVYSQNTSGSVYADNYATAQVIYTLYNNNAIENPGFISLSQVIQNFYPNSGADGWEYYLTGNTRLLNQPNAQYGLLLEHIYQCEINNNTNPYWFAFNISKYIYLWLGKQRFVYIGENIFPLNNAFILNLNSLGNCILLGGQNYNVATIYVLTDNPDGTSSITEAEQQQINIFIRQIAPAAIPIQVDYTKSAANLNLVYLGNTYFKDPRQANSFCIAYNQNILDEALGYTANNNQTVITDLISFSIIPANNAQLNKNQTYAITITTNPVWSGSLPVEQFVQLYSDDETLLTTQFVGGTLSLITNPTNTGTVNLTIYLGILNVTYTYTIT